MQSGLRLRFGAEMSGVTEAEFKQMMIDGGRSVDGNRYTSEWQDG